MELVSMDIVKNVRKPSIQDLMESIGEGFDKLLEKGVSIEQPYTKLQLLDDMIWNTLVSLGLA